MPILADPLPYRTARMVLVNANANTQHSRAGQVQCAGCVFFLFGPDRKQAQHTDRSGPNPSTTSLLRPSNALNRCSNPRGLSSAAQGAAPRAANTHHDYARPPLAHQSSQHQPASTPIRAPARRFMPLTSAAKQCHRRLIGCRHRCLLPSRQLLQLPQLHASLRPQWRYAPRPT